MRASGRPLSKTDDSLPDVRGQRERRALEAGVGRVGEQVDPGGGDLLADPGAAAAAAVDRLALVGDPRAGVPVGVDHQVGHRGRRQDRVVAPGREVDPPRAPAEPLREVGVDRERVDVGEVAGGAADPGAVGQVGGLAGAAVVAGGLHVPQPEPGGGAEVGRGDLVVDEAVEHRLADVGPAERLAERGRERVVDVDVGGPGGVVPVGGDVASRTRSSASSAGAPARAAASAACTSVVDLALGAWRCR